MRLGPHEMLARREQARQAVEQRHSDTELPANRAVREQNERIAASNTAEAARARHEAGERARLARDAEVRKWSAFRKTLAEAQNAAAGERDGRLLAHDLEGAIAAQARLDGLKALMPAYLRVAQRQFPSGPFIDRVAHGA